MQYVSHVLHFPSAKPFNNPTTRWPSFIGEFVRPIVIPRPDLVFWFTDYGDRARFRVYIDDYTVLQTDIETLRDKLALTDHGEEKALTLVQDLGGGRFISPHSKSTPQIRAELVVKALCGMARLVVDSVVQNQSGEWEFEKNEDKVQNPDESHLFSVNHLLHNMSASDALIYLYQNGADPDVLSHYYFWNAVNQKQITPHGHKSFRVRM